MMSELQPKHALHNLIVAAITTFLILEMDYSIWWWLAAFSVMIVKVKEDKNEGK